MLILSLFFLNGVLLADSQPETGTGSPENITVQLIDAKTVEVFWASSWKNVERYDITYNPTENRVVSQAAGNSHSIVLRELKPNTQYQVTVTAVVAGKNYKSRRLVFRTFNDPNKTLEEIQPVPTKPTRPRRPYPVTPEIINPDPTAIGSKYTPQTSTTVRGVEIGLVLLALVVWMIAIALFFHRWGKIRMLLPYQPDYKTQQSLKVPGTGTTIGSGCTGNTATQGQQEGPGCVQHLRWSSRYFDEPPTAKKCSPSRWSIKPRVSSAIFPASPSFFYARTSAECESPRMIRHAHSHGEFPPDEIPMCQVSQPRRESSENIISINVPVIASNVNEKALSRKSGEGKPSEQLNEIIKFEESECFKKEKRDNSYLSPFKDKDDNILKLCSAHSHYHRSGERSERTVEKGEKTQKSEPLFFVEATEQEKPRRYTRSSFKKQKVRLYDDKDYELIKNVPTFECQEKNQNHQEPECDKSRRDQKTSEMRRKAFLRKISLQDTYLNYNQDYWLDFKKSGRFHKSIDLGCFGNDENGITKTEISKKVMEKNLLWTHSFLHCCESNQKQSLTIIRQSNLPSKKSVEGSLRRTGSDPVIFTHKKSSCTNSKLIDSIKNHNSGELLTDAIVSYKKKEFGGKKSSWFFLESDENIPLFSERNGLIETDFDVLDEKYPEDYVFRHSSNQLKTEENSFAAPIDFSDFYEIKLTSDSEGESAKKSAVPNFQDSCSFFDKTITSGDSDVFIETEPENICEEARVSPPYLARSSSSPPKFSSH